MEVQKLEISNRIKEMFQSKTAAFIMAAAIILIAILARQEVIEPLIILFVIYCSLSFAKKGAVYSTIFAISVLAIQDLYKLNIDLYQYLIEVSVIIIAAFYIYKSTSSVKKLNFELRERVKELTGLYRISEAAESSKTDLDQILNEVVQGLSLIHI